MTKEDLRRLFPPLERRANGKRKAHVPSEQARVQFMAPEPRAPKVVFTRRMSDGRDFHERD